MTVRGPVEEEGGVDVGIVGGCCAWLVEVDGVSPSELEVGNLTSREVKRCFLEGTNTL